MHVALIFPPTSDPTAPYSAVPMLTAVLRSHGVEVLPIDANVEVYHCLLQRSVLNEMGSKIVKRLSRLERKNGLNHSDQLRYGRLWEALPDLAWVPAAIEDAVCVLKTDRAIDSMIRRDMSKQSKPFRPDPGLSVPPILL